MAGKLLRAVIVLAISGFVFAYLPLEALDREGLLFYSSLDGRADADFARGKSEAFPGYKSAFTEGVRGQAAVVGKESGLIKTLEAPISFWLDIDIPVNYVDEFIGALRYSQPQNLRWQEGTLSFWVKPLDWDCKDGNNHYLAHMEMEDTLSFVWSVYPPWLEYRQSRISDRDIYKKNATGPAPEKDKWQQISVSWRDKEQWTYVNGKLSKYTTEGVPGYIGGGSYFAFGDAQKFHTAFDEILVLAEALGEAGAKALYDRVTKDGSGPLVTLPETDGKITIDGQIDEAEYSGAAKLTGWIDAILGIANDDGTKANLTYDKDNLYIAFTFPIPEKYRRDKVGYVARPVKMDAEEADSEAIFDDDYFEVIIGVADKDVYRFALNAAGTRYDSKNGDKSWNGNWKHQTRFDDNFWTVELALPFSIFGRVPAVGETWKLNLRHQAKRVIEMDSVWAYSGPDPDAMGALRFGGGIPAIQIERITNPANGNVEIEASVEASILKQPDRWQFHAAIPDAPEKFETTRTLALAPGKTKKVAVSYILPRALAADLVISIKDKGGNDLFIQRLPFVFSLQTGLSARLLPSPKKLLVEIDLGATSLLKKGVTGELSIKDSKGKKLKTASVDKLKSVRETLGVDIAEVPVGRYTVAANLKAAGRALPEMTAKFEIKPKPEWLGTHVGVGQDVLAPFTPLESNANSISCWGRTYTYGDSVFPAKIEILGKELLAGPMTLDIKEGGKSVSVSGAKLAFTSKKPNRIEYILSGSAGSFDVKTENWIEYDGLIWVKIIVTPRKKPAVMEEMALVIPYNNQIATHWYNGQYRPDSATGYIPKEYAGPVCGRARIGDVERGLQWCWEHTYNWKIADKSTAMEMRREKDAYRVKLKFVDHKISVDEPIEIEIGLQALPARPQPKKFHGWYWGGHPANKTKSEPRLRDEVPIVCLWNTGVWPFWNAPKMTLKEMAGARKSKLERWLKYKVTDCIYSNHQGVSPMIPEYRYYQEEWRIVPSSRPNFAALDAQPLNKVRHTSYTAVCLGSESYADYHMYYLRKSLKYMTGRNPKIPVGLYYDVSHVASCANHYHGCGVKIDGQWKEKYALLEWRRNCERIRRILKGINRDAWYTVHMSGDPLMATWSFNDIMIPGEQYAAYFKMKKAQAQAAGEKWPDDYTKMCGLDRVRAEYSSQGYGPAQVFLSEIWTWAKGMSKEEQHAARRHCYGLMFVNDVASWANDSAKTLVLNAMWEHLGWDYKVKFIGYWQNQQYLNMQPYDENKIVASIYEREGKIAGYENGKLVEPIDKKEYALSGTKVAVTLPRRDFQLFFLKK